MTKKKRKQILQLSGLHIFYIILCLLALVPILYALNLSFERGEWSIVLRIIFVSKGIYTG